MENIQNWCLWDGHTNNDYLLSAEEINALPELEQQDDIIFEYNQGDSNDCTIYSALGALSDLFNREVTQEQIEECNEESYKRWRIRGAGWYTKMAVETCCDKWMIRYPTDKVFFYALRNRNNEENFNKILEKWYSICTSFNGNRSYQKDREDNGQIDKADHGESTYGHAVNLRKYGKWDRAVKDSYKGRKTNIYGLIPTIDELNNAGTRQNWSYVILKDKSAEEKIREDIKRLNRMKTRLTGMIEDNSAMWEDTHDEEYRKELHIINEMNRKKIQDCNRELAKYFKS